MHSNIFFLSVARNYIINKKEKCNKLTLINMRIQYKLCLFLHLIFNDSFMKMHMKFVTSHLSTDNTILSHHEGIK
jgi:hypothetical protein